MEYIAAELYLTQRWKNEDAGPPAHTRPRRRRFAGLPLRVRRIRYGMVMRNGVARNDGRRPVRV